jgi:hypothetical protein
MTGLQTNNWVWVVRVNANGEQERRLEYIEDLDLTSVDNNRFTQEPYAEDEDNRMFKPVPEGEPKPGFGTY